MTSAWIDNGTILLGEPMVDGRSTLTTDETTHPPGDELVFDVRAFDDDEDEEDFEEFEDEELDEDEFEEDEFDEDEDEDEDED